MLPAHPLGACREPAVPAEVIQPEDVAADLHGWMPGRQPEVRDDALERGKLQVLWKAHLTGWTGGVPDHPVHQRRCSKEIRVSSFTGTGQVGVQQIQPFPGRLRTRKHEERLMLRRQQRHHEGTQEIDRSCGIDRLISGRRGDPQQGEPKALLQWAASVGPSCEKTIGYHLQDRRDLANGLRAARHVRNLARDYGEGRFESACAYAWPLNITALRSMNSILANQADLRPPRPAPTQPRPLHPNVRGAQYFGE